MVISSWIKDEQKVESELVQADLDLTTLLEELDEPLTAKSE